MLYKEYLLTSKVNSYRLEDQQSFRKEIKKYSTRQWQRLYEKGYRLKDICANKELLLYDMESKSYIVIKEALESEGL